MIEKGDRVLFETENGRTLRGVVLHWSQKNTAHVVVLDEDQNEWVVHNCACMKDRSTDKSH